MRILYVRPLAVSAVLVILACTPGPAASQDVSAPSRSPHWNSLDSILRASYPADGPGATAIVVRDGKVVYRGAAGMANIELGVPMRPELVFPLYSVGKQFTAAAILMLAEDGKLALTDPLTRFFPEYPVPAKPVTVEHLLGHTSGLSNYTDNPAWQPMVRQHVSTDELVALFRNEPFRFDPGERWEYNNSAYVLLGRIIERVSGMSYGDFLRTRIFKPLGMSSTYVYDAPEAIITGRVANYSKGPDGWINSEYFSLTHGNAAGNLLSSVDDLARWNAAIERGELLSPRSWQRAFTSFKLHDGTETRYAAGWFLRTLGALATAEHTGDFMGGISSVVRVPTERLYVAVLANADPAPADPERLSLELAARVLGISPHPAEVLLTSRQLDEYVGQYRTAEGATRTIVRDGARLHIQRQGGERIPLYAIGGDMFYITANGMTMRFDRENGRVASVVVIPRQDAPGPPARRAN